MNKQFVEKQLQKLQTSFVINEIQKEPTAFFTYSIIKDYFKLSICRQNCTEADIIGKNFLQDNFTISINRNSVRFILEIHPGKSITTVIIQYKHSVLL